MRRRLIVLATTLVSALLVALMVPLIDAYAADRTQDLFVKRLGDVTRFAVLAEDALEGGDADSLVVDLDRYTEVYGGEIVVINANREVVAAAPGSVDVGTDDVAAAISRALVGAGSLQPPTAWPWTPEPFVVGSPVGRDAQVLGAVVVVSPTDSVRDDVGRWLAVLVVAGLAVLVVTAYVLVTLLVGWILRPVHDLDAAAHRLAGGDLSSRVPDRTGPPELRALATSFNVMADNVETSQQRQRALVADASHQLGNPLTALRLRVENLGATVSGTAAEDLAKVLEESDRLNAIVESLLDLSQVGAQSVPTTCVDIAARARHRCDMWSPMFSRLDVRAPDSAPAAATDGIVDVVLDALLDNAAKFAEGSPVDVTVSVVDGGDVVLNVRDHGPGLDADDIAKVGARFFRGRRHQNVPGTGLGLAIVRARVVDIGGSFSVAPAPGGGLRVETRFPAWAGEPVGPDGSAATQAVSGPARGSNAASRDGAPAER
jgi:signal transduction histidine kinase